ncbi:MAG: hypothetical protein R3325_00970 [Thermoanaerobaculia bacterium]|nr:hypothetical protein [Thermoanaerobaculia bacterium]
MKLKPSTPALGKAGPGLLALGLLALAAGPWAAEARASSVEVRMRLPVKARLDLQGKRSIAIAPFLIVTQEGEEAVTRRGVNVREEFEDYLMRLLRRQTPLKIVDAGAVDYPSYDLDELSSNEDFWRVLGERLEADLILSGSLDFDIQDRSGYKTEPYVSPFDSRTYYRQVLVEQTGFEYDIVLQVYDGQTGKSLYSDNFKDFKRFEGESVDPLEGMFENLYALEDRIGGVFSRRTVETTRTLFN